MFPTKCGRRFIPAAILFCLAAAMPRAARSQMLEPPYDSSYSILDLGPIPGVPDAYGGVTFLAGNPGVLLIGGDANEGVGAVYRIDLTRDPQGHITGFSGTATLHATAPQIDGGLFYGPGGVLFTTAYPINQLHQILPSGSAPARTIDLNALGICSSVGGGTIVPAGYGNSGKMLLFSYNCSTLYQIDLSPDGSGTYDLTNVTQINALASGPEGLIHIPPASPLFADFQSILVTEYASGMIAAWDLEASGQPDPLTRRTFISGFFGAEGAAIDPFSGDFVFSTYSGASRLISVRGLGVPASPTPTPTPPAPTPTASPLPPTPSATATPPPPTPTAPPCCPGDANNSGGAVNAQDFLSVQANFGLDNGVNGAGDANCSGGAVNAQDFLSVQANFGLSCD